MIISLRYVFSLLVFSILFISFSANPPQGRTGAPGESSCASATCHTGNNILIQGEVQVNGLPEQATPGSIYPLTVQLLQTSGALFRGGFQMTILANDENSTGMLLNPGSNSTVSHFGNRQYFEHEPAKSFDGESIIEYTVEWKAPDIFESDEAIVFLAANFTNGNASNTGDRIVLYSDSITTISSLPIQAEIIKLEKACLTHQQIDLTLQIGGGCPPYEVLWNNAQSADTLLNVLPGRYFAKITDSKADSFIINITIDSTQSPFLLLPDTLSIDAPSTPADLKTLFPEPCSDSTEVVLSPKFISCMDYPGLTVSALVRDEADNAYTRTFYVSIVDTTPPALTCIQSTLNISTCAPLSYALPKAIDNCGDPSLRLKSGIGINRSFPAGTTLDIYEASDDAGNTAQCTIKIVNTLTLDLDIQVTDISCFGEQDGKAEIAISGPNAPYMFGLTDSLLPPENLGKGAYELKINDHSGCSFTRTFTVDEPSPIMITGVEVKHPQDLNSGDGAILPIISGGTPPYSFMWYTEDELFSTDDKLELLFPGIYFFELKDKNNCMVTSDSIMVDAITPTKDIEFSEFFRVFPNPADQILYIRALTAFSSLDAVEIFDSYGKRVYFSTLDSKELNISSLPHGTYLLRISYDKHKRFVQKVVKIR